MWTTSFSVCFRFQHRAAPDPFLLSGACAGLIVCLTRKCTAEVCGLWRLKSQSCKNVISIGPGGQQCSFSERTNPRSCFVLGLSVCCKLSITNGLPVACGAYSLGRGLLRSFVAQPLGVQRCRVAFPGTSAQQAEIAGREGMGSC